MRLYILSLVIFAAAACSKPIDVDSPSAAQELTLKNEAYGTDAKQKIDVYLPANRTDTGTRVLILVHGGGWNEGDKADFDQYVTVCKQLFPSYAVININYRLSTNGVNTFPAQENDVKAVADFINAKRSEWHISTKWAWLGASAGGHLALLQAYKYNNPVKARAVISFFGPTDLTALYNNPPNLVVPIALAAVIGATPVSNPAIYSQSSPITFVNAQSSPTLILQGGMDPLVPAAQSELLRDKLKTQNVPYQYVFYPQEGHGWTGTPLNDSFSKIKSFLDTYM